MCPVHLEVELEGTVGVILVGVWLACEGYMIGLRQHWTATTTILAQCNGVPYLSEVGHLHRKVPTFTSMMIL